MRCRKCLHLRSGHLSGFPAAGDLQTAQKTERREAEPIRTEEEFAALLAKYERLVYTLCYRMSGNPFDAQDLTQDTFLSVYQRLCEFDGEHERAWICRIAVNKCLDYQKSAARRIQPAKEEVFSELPDQKADPEAACLMDESKREVLALCRQLPPPYDEVAEAHFYEERSIREIAEEKGRNIRTVQTQVYRAKGLLKKKLKGGRIG